MKPEVVRISRHGGAVKTETMRFLTLEQARREAKAINPNRCHHRTGQCDSEIYRASKYAINGHIYFVLSRSTRTVKIGFTAQPPKSRLYQLQGANSEKLELLGTFPGTLHHEKELHRRFADYRIRREWFQYKGELREAITGFLKAQKEAT